MQNQQNNQNDQNDTTGQNGKGDKDYLKDYKDFVEDMLSHMQTPERSILKRFFGTPISRVPMQALIAFFKSVYYGGKSECWTEQLEAAFFVTCLAAKFNIKPDNEENADDKNKKIPLEEIIGKLYRKKESKDTAVQHKIDDLLSSKMDERACNIIKLAAIIRLLDEEQIMNLDLAKLYHDIHRWDSENNLLYSCKAKWASSIVCDWDAFNKRNKKNEAVVEVSPDQA